MSRIRIFLFLFGLFLPSLFAADSDFPELAGVKYKETHQVTLAGITVEARVYESKESLQGLSSAYQNYFNQSGFTRQERKDENNKTKNKDEKSESLSFTKGDVSFLMKISDGPADREINIARRIQDQNNSKFSADKITWQEALALMPKEDTAGADLDSAPRPPDSVRLAGNVYATIAMLNYVSTRPMAELVDFYLKAMPEYGWKLNRSVFDLDAGLQEAKKNDIKVPVEQSFAADFYGLNVGEFAKGSKIISFVNEKGSIDVTLFHVEPGKDARNFVQIYYAEKTRNKNAAKKK